VGFFFCFSLFGSLLCCLLMLCSAGWAVLSSAGVWFLVFGCVFVSVFLVLVAGEACRLPCFRLVCGGLGPALRRRWLALCVSGVAASVRACRVAGRRRVRA